MMIGKPFKKLGKASIGAVILAVMLVGVALAITPTIDGDDSGDWGSNPTTCTIGSSGCSRILDDGEDVTQPDTADYYDIQHVFSTNDATYFYFRLDFYGNGTTTANTWYPTAGGSTPILNICLDIDNNTGTGQTLGAGLCDGGETMSGVDYRIAVFPSPGNPGLPAAPRVHTCLDSSCVNQTAAGTIGYDSHPPGDPGVDSDTITEIRVQLSDLGIGATCPDGGPEPCEYRIGLYYDNGVEPSDDSVPDDGYATPTFGSGSPTIVSFESIEARTESSGGLPLAAAGLVLALALLYFARRARRAAG